MEIDFSIRASLFIRMALIEEPQRALEEFFNIFFGGLVRREKLMQIEVGKTTIRHPRGKQLAQPPRFDGTQATDLLEHDALQRILKNRRIDKPAYFLSRAALDQNRTKQP